MRMKKRVIMTLSALFLTLAAVTVLLVVNVNAAYEEYGLYIGGTQVTSKNLSGSGWRFEPDTNTLVLNGFEITSGGHFHKKTNDGTTWVYSFIYVDDSKYMDLTIRTEGKESTIGYGTMAGNPEVRSSTGDGTYESYYGIYNKNGNVTITGSAKLSIYTSQLCIYTKQMIIVDECRAPVSMHAYAVGINCADLIVKGGSKFNVYCGYSGGMDHESAIIARQSISLYDTSELHADVERWSSSTKGYIAALSCPDGTVNVYGGKLTAVCHMGGKQSDKFPECFAIRAGTLNISGGGVVEALVRTASGQKHYRESITVGQYNSSTGTINFKGNGTLRAGVEMKNPNGGQRLYPERFNHLNNTVGYTSDLKLDGNEVIYIEYTSYEREGIFLHEFGNNTHWSYYRHPSLERNNYLFFFDLNDAIIAGTDYHVYSVSGTQSMMPYVESGEIPAITVESGELTLWLKSDYTHNFTKPIEVKKGATLKIFGFGTANGLDIRGEGTVIFQSGTVTGTVQKSLKMVVEGGNVNVEYDGQATDANGVKVWRQPYVLGNENASFTKVSQISVRNGRSYSVYGTYPIDGRKVFLWMQSAEELESLSAVPSGYSSSLTLKGNPGNPLWLTLFQSIATNERTLYAATRGMSVTIRPFASAPTAEQMKEYKLIWSYSDNGLNWTTIENPDCDSECQLTYTVPTGESWINRTFRCELRKTATNEQLGVYTATLHLANLKIVNETPFSENKMVKLRLTEGTLPPNGQNVTLERIRWYISDDGGRTYRLHDPANGKEVYSFKVTAALDGRIIRCEARLSDGTTLTEVAVSEPITVKVTDRWVEIIKQPESITIKVPTGNDQNIKVIDRYATSYQWQVSKRTYPGEDVPFEDIPGANKYYHALGWSTPMLLPGHRYYAYRCVVSNEFSEVITDEVTLELLFNPYFYDIKGYDTTIREGEDALFETKIMGGNPLVATGVYWEVNKGNGFVRLSDVEELKGLCAEESITETIDGVTYHTRTALKITKAPLRMNGYIFRCVMTYGDYRTDMQFHLKVLTECQQNGHDWSEATCTTLSTCSKCGETRGELLPHTGGKATCISGAICEVCGNEYGDYDRNTHPDGATDVWNVEDWGDDAGHHSKWSCCGQPKYPYEYHKWEEGICTVCGCICEHSLNSPANCHERARCHTCGIEYGEINPNNHDLEWYGTYMSGEKDPTCTEEGYTGDLCCYECHGVITKGDVIPAKGHDDSWPATCKEPAWCSVCREHFGDVDPDNHAEPWSANYENITETTHDKHWYCCGMVKTEPHDPDENGVCRSCHYGCEHTGGEANCMEPAHCEKCGEPYGEKNPNRHEYTQKYACDNATHVERCKCGVIIGAPEPHTWENGWCTECYYDCRHIGGTATCTEEAICENCGERYGNAKGHTFGGWIKDATGHWHACADCGEKADEAAHTPGDAATETAPQLCTVCHYEIMPATGHTHSFDCENPDEIYLKSAATCRAKAVYYYSCSCGVSGEETFTSGETLPHHYSDGWFADGEKHWRACTACGQRSEEAAHEDTDGNHGCDICQLTISMCNDANNDHMCDICGKMLSVCRYATDWSSDAYTHWHACVVCGRKADEAAHADTDKDHNCDTCGKTLSECADNNKDHKCDLCGKTMSACADGNMDHKCDLCGKTLSECADDNKDHKCDLCGKTLSECVDNNKDHKCDACGKQLTVHTGGTATCTEKATCSICGQEYGELAAHNYKTEWSTDETNHWHECSVCGDKKDVAAHIPGAEATETTPQTCTVCDYVIREVLKSVTVSFSANGGSGTMLPVTGTIGDTFTAPDCGFVAPDGCRFKGWALENGTEVVSFTLNSDVTLFAVWESEWEAAIRWALESGMFEDDGSFDPKKSMTIGEFWYRAWKAAGSPAATGRTMYFVDVPADAYYYEAVLWALEHKYVNTPYHRKLKPDSVMTRQMIIMSMYGISGKPFAEGNVHFTDTYYRASYIKALDWAVETGIVTDTVGGAFKPHKNASGEDILLWMFRMWG